MIRNVPHLALIPLVILWFGIDEEAKVFLVALGVFFPIYINTLHGVRTVDPQLIEMASSYGIECARVVFSRRITRRVAFDFCRLTLRSRHYVADPDRCRDDRRTIGRRLYGDGGA